ncbi:hypothetical protein JW826_03445 [Candidatus Woesearchaeota archaeon]|nr:hypothetical protein [Candidatus Woesearchaeota archaeon]
MKLGSKTLVFMSLILLALIVLWGFYYRSVGESLFHLEEDYLKDDLRRASNLVDLSLESIDHRLGDWAQWDDSYDYVRSPNDDFIETNLNNDTLPLLNLDLLVIADSSGKVLYELYDTGEGQCDKEFFDLNRKEKRLLTSFHDREMVRQSGLVICGNNSALFVARPVLPSDGSGAPVGVILFAKFFRGKIPDFERQLLLSVEVGSWQDESLPEDMELVKGFIDLGSSEYISSDRENLYGYLLVNDWLGRPGVIMKLTKPRTLSAAERDFFYMLSLFVILGAAALVISIFFFIRQVILRRINNVYSFFSHVIQTQDLSKRIICCGKNASSKPLYGYDELCSLCDNINILLSMLEKSQKSVLEQADEVVKINEKLLEADKLKEVLFSNISHELKTPLTAVRAYNQLLYDGSFGRVNKKQKETLEIALRSTDYLNNIISELLELSRFEAGKANLFFEDVDLQKLIKETIREFDPKLREAKGKVNFSCPKGFVVSADSLRMKEVFQNLISNSIKYKDIRKLMIDITCSYMKEGDAVVEFKDNAKGISEEDLEHIFDRFYQIDKNVRAGEFESTGLGLSILKHIIEAHGGSIKIESALGVGTTFRMVIPKKASFSNHS